MQQKKASVCCRANFFVSFTHSLGLYSERKHTNLNLLEYSALAQDLIDLFLCRNLCLGNDLHGIEYSCGEVDTQQHLKIIYATVSNYSSWLMYW